jgi:hypothetical protein
MNQFNTASICRQEDKDEFIVSRNMTNVGHGVCLTASEGGIDSKIKLYRVGSDRLVTVTGDY